MSGTIKCFFPIQLNHLTLNVFIEYQENMSDQNAGILSEFGSLKEDTAAGEAPRKKLKIRCREKVSWVWQYFIKEGSVAVCQFCQASFSFSSTTTLSYHLNHVHEELDLIRDKIIPNATQKSNKPQIQQISRLLNFCTYQFLIY